MSSFCLRRAHSQVAAPPRLPAAMAPAGAGVAGGSVFAPIRHPTKEELAAATLLCGMFQGVRGPAAVRPPLLALTMGRRSIRRCCSLSLAAFIGRNKLYRRAEMSRL